MTEKGSLSLTGNTLKVLQANPGVTFTPQQLQLVQRGTIEIKRGCIIRMVYQNNSDNLAYVQLDPDGGVNASNFKDFRRLFEEAACCGYEILFCYNTDSREISMPHLLPCRCKCSKRD